MAGLRILVVDDEELVRFSLGEMLRRRNDDFELAEDGPEALEVLRKRDFDVLVSDLSMPKMHGLELINEARKIRPQMVSIVLTGLGTRDDVINALKVGVFDFVEKPIYDLRTFGMVIDRAGERAHLIRERDQLLRDLKSKNTKLEISLQQRNDAYARLQRQEKDLEADLQQAQRMHQRLLPSAFPKIPGLQLYGFFCPCERLGGDFFGVVPLDNKRVALYLADVAGHGVGAAMITVIIRELIHAQQTLGREPDLLSDPVRTLKYINDGLVAEDFEPPILVTMVYAVLDAHSGEICAACAGHPPPLLIAGPERHTFLPATGPVLGIDSGVEYFAARFNFEPDDLLLLYSDGITEARDSNAEELGEKGLARWMSHCHGMLAHEAGTRLEERLGGYQQGEAAMDDETFLVVRRTDPTQSTPETTTPEVRIIHTLTCRTPRRLRARVSIGIEGNLCLIRLHGKATWMLGPSLCQAIDQARHARVSLVCLDLSDCQFLDSTMLGLLHEHAHIFMIYGASADILGQFQQMGIYHSLCFSSQPTPEIVLKEVVGKAASDDERVEMMLRAHESLMSANEENRVRFEEAVRMLHAARQSPPETH